MRSSSWNTTACRSRAPKMAGFISDRFGGMTTHFGEGTAQRTCAAADRTGHAMLHTLYQQSLKHDAEFYIEYFAVDLIMEDGVCRGVRRDRPGHRPAASLSFPPGHSRDWRLRPFLFFLHLGTHLHRRRQRDGVARRSAACRTWSSCSFIRPAFMAPAA